MAERQRYLAAELFRRYPGRVFHVPVRALAEGSLPETCLLRIVGNEGNGLPGAAIRDPSEMDISGRVGHDEYDLLGTSEIRLALNGEAREVVIGGSSPSRDLPPMIWRHSWLRLTKKTGQGGARPRITAISAVPN
jgi:hypothetical protein